MDDVIEIKNIFLWIVKKWKLILSFVISCCIVGCAMGAYDWLNYHNSMESNPFYIIEKKLIIVDSDGKIPKSVEGVPIDIANNIKTLLLTDQVYETVSQNYMVDELRLMYNYKKSDKNWAMNSKEILRERIFINIVASDQITLTTDSYDRDRGAKVMDEVTTCALYFVQSTLEDYSLKVIDTVITTSYPESTGSIYVSIIRYAALFVCVGGFGILFILLMIYIFSDNLKGKVGISQYSFPVLGGVSRKKVKNDNDRAFYYATKTALIHSLNGAKNKTVFMPDTAVMSDSNVCPNLCEALVACGYNVMLINADGLSKTGFPYSNFTDSELPPKEAATVNIYFDYQVNQVPAIIESDKFHDFLENQKRNFDYVIIHSGGQQLGEVGALASLCDGIIPITYQNQSKQSRIADMLIELTALDCNILGLLYVE